MDELLLRKVRVHDLIFGERTEITRSHSQHTTARELIRYLLEDSHLKSVEIKLARPGEKNGLFPSKMFWSLGPNREGPLRPFLASWVQPSLWEPGSPMS